MNIISFVVNYLKLLLLFQLVYTIILLFVINISIDSAREIHLSGSKAV
jgi:hypothetical protein